MNSDKGLTLVELIIVMAIIAVLAATGIPQFVRYLPKMRLKSASRDLISNMQFARMKAIRDNAPCRLHFETGVGRYCVLDVNGTTCRTVDLSDYPGITFGSNNPARIDANHTPPQTDGVSYQGNKAKFNANGSAAAGTVYLKNDHGHSMAVGTSSWVGRVRAWCDFGSGWEE
jgi:prepilin-type N-terminal cleavage/methylation domain-containing protein